MSDEETVLLKGDRTRDVDEQYTDTLVTTKKRTCKERLMHVLRRNKEEEDDEEELHVIEEDPVERAKRIEDMTSWIKTGCLLVIAIVCIGAGLIYLEFVLVPLVLARFCVYLFQPFINYMVGKKPIGSIRLRIPRVIAITICFIFVIILFILLGIAIYFSVQSILRDWDKYEDRFLEVYDKIVAFLEENGFDITEIEAMLPDVFVGDIIPFFLAQVSALVPQGTLALLFLIYMLLEYDQNYQKADLQRTIDAKIRGYIVLKIIISVLVGIVVGIILSALRVDMWILFALLTFLLNFIPNVGSMIACILPIPIAIFDPDQTWWSILLVIFLPFAAHFIIGNFVEPIFMGKSMHISAVAVLVSLAFWGGVWGFVGAIMSVPLTVILHVWLCSFDHPMTQFLGGIMGGEFNVFKKKAAPPPVPPPKEHVDFD